MSYRISAPVQADKTGPAIAAMIEDPGRAPGGARLEAGSWR